MSLSKPNHDSGVKALLRRYQRLLKERPVLTKACTSACTAALGNLLSQYIVPSGSNRINWRSVLAFAMTGFLFVGPVMHHFYRFLEKAVPSNSSRVTMKRLLIDRLLYTPLFLIIYLYCVSVFESRSFDLDHQKILGVYKIAVKMNWKALTIVQYINIKYVPQEYRVLVGNVISLAWNCFIAMKRKT